MKLYTKQNTRNSAEMNTPIAEIFKVGENEVKSQVLNSLKKEFRDAHLSGEIHIHDLESYSLTYNCLNLDWIDDFKRYNKSQNSKDRLSTIFNIEFYLMDTIYKLGNDQSGGISFPNFDIEIAEVLGKKTLNSEECKILKHIFINIIKHLNFNKTRQGQVNYYVTFNLGLDKTVVGRQVTRLFLEAFNEQSQLVFKPNIVFKVTEDDHLSHDGTNHDLLNLAIRTTVKKMIPTYLMVDSKINKGLEPKKQSIAGCRTRIYENRHGEDGSIGRYNITSTSINLPRISFESGGDINKFFKILDDRMTLVGEQIFDRYKSLSENLTKDSIFSFRERGIYSKDIKNIKNINEFLDSGTYSIGYIGLYEAVFILMSQETHSSPEAMKLALKIIKKMRRFTDVYAEEKDINMSLISPAGEMISGRFVFQDLKMGYRNKVIEKGFYTNSFHIKVDSNISSEQKIILEAPFHELSNGGCISYLELFDANSHLSIIPKDISLEQKIIEILKLSNQEGINYLGFNFPIDICKECREIVYSDICENCGSSRIANIRRVSGYIEILETFVDGKVKEEKFRKKNG